MMLVVTGIDKTGKSTLSRKLADFLQAEYKHFSKPPVKAHAYFAEVFKHKARKHVVVDRWCEGDYIYAKGMGHEQRLTVHELDSLLKEAEAKGLIYIFCWDHEVDVRRRFKHEKETFVPPNKIGKIQKLFLDEAKRLASRYTFPVLLMNNFTNELEVLSYGTGTGMSGRLLPQLVSGAFEDSFNIRSKDKPKGTANQGNAGLRVPSRQRGKSLDSDPCKKA